MSIAIQTVNDLNLVLNGTPEVRVNFKARLAIKAAKEQIAGGVTSIDQQPTLYASIIAKAILNESNR